MASRISIGTFGERMFHPHSALYFFLEDSVTSVLPLQSSPSSKTGFRIELISLFQTDLQQ